MAPLEELSAFVLLPDSPELSLVVTSEVVIVESEAVVEGSVDSVVVGVLAVGSTAGPVVELLEDAASTGPPPAPSSLIWSGAG